ncbi:hypothetical protein GGI35DRAFT_267543 [Trichoderma velutinum]
MMLMLPLRRAHVSCHDACIAVLVSGISGRPASYRAYSTCQTHITGHATHPPMAAHFQSFNVQSFLPGGINACLAYFMLHAGLPLKSRAATEPPSRSPPFRRSP